VLQENKNDSTKIWKTVNELSNIRSKKVGAPLELKTDTGKIWSSATDIAEKLNKHFASIGAKMAKTISPVNPISEYKKNETNKTIKIHYF